MKWSRGHTKSRERNNKIIIMEDITSNDIEYTSLSNIEIQRPHYDALNKEKIVGENLGCNLDKEDEQVAHAHGMQRLRL